MADVYVTLQQDHCYSELFVQSYMPELTEYVRAVDWLGWEYQYKKKNPYIIVTGNHNLLERVQVVLQRLKHRVRQIYVREHKGDEWLPYVAPRFFTESEMIAIEQENRFEVDEIAVAKNDILLADECIVKWEFLESRNMAVGDGAIFYNLKADAEERLYKAEAAEQERLLKIKSIWKRVD